MAFLTSGHGAGGRGGSEVGEGGGGGVGCEEGARKGGGVGEGGRERLGRT